MLAERDRTISFGAGVQFTVDFHNTGCICLDVATDEFTSAQRTVQRARSSGSPVDTLGLAFHVRQTMTFGVQLDVSGGEQPGNHR